MSGMSVSSSDLGLKNPQQPYGYAHLALACVLSLLLAGYVISLLGSSNDSPTGVPGITKSLSIVAAITAGLVAVLHAVTGLRALLAFVVQSGAPAGLLNSPQTIERLLKSRVIDHTYQRPTGLLQLLLYRFNPRLVYLTPARRFVTTGLWNLVVWSILAMASVWLVGWWSACLFIVTALACAFQLAAIVFSDAEVPSTEHIYEHQDHLGDKGDPIGLYHQSRRVVESFRVDPFQNRYLVEQLPRVAERVNDARVESTLLLETQPVPVNAARPSPPSALIMDGAAVILSIIGWALLLYAFRAGEQPMLEMIPLAAAGGIALFASTRFFGIAFALHNTFRFESDLFWVVLDGSYNTTRVGSRDQRTSFQSDLQLYLFGARVVSECTPAFGLSDGPAVVSAMLGDSALRAPRYLVTTVQSGQLRSRLEILFEEMRHYQDEGGSARPTDLTSPEYQQHLLRLQAEAFAEEQARLGAWTNSGLLPSATPTAIPGPTAGPAQSRGKLVGPALNLSQVPVQQPQVVPTPTTKPPQPQPRVSTPKPVTKSPAPPPPPPPPRPKSKGGSPGSVSSGKSVPATPPKKTPPPPPPPPVPPK